MVIDGKAIAQSILSHLSDEVSLLKKRGVTPTLAVILLGDNPASLSYIKQKQKAALQIGAKLILDHMPNTISPETLQSTIAHYNTDPSVHGIIIQRPTPVFVGEGGDILATVTHAKDVDGFVPNSPFEVPVARATLMILNHVHEQLVTSKLVQGEFPSWLGRQTIAVIGRGETAGRPIANALKKYDCAISVIHSKTMHPEKILKSASVVISCVGKERVIKKNNIPRGTILIGVGLWRDSEGKLHGDYEEEEIQKQASFYTPTPGGVGPVNVACLMHNLVDAAHIASTA